MDSAPSLDTVVQALDTLYHNPNVAGKEEASIWLGKLQGSVYAWQIADQLLQLNKDIESCYFAAQTMRTKIQYAFAELPHNAHQSLRDSLLNHAQKITSDTPTVITTQLCLALADLALQMVSWKGATVDLLQRFGSDLTHLHFLIELLVVLPEELHSNVLRMGANRREEMSSELRDAASMMLQLLSACVENCGTDEHLQSKVFKCLGSWLNLQLLPQADVANSNVLTAAFQALTNYECPSQLHESASDCVISALYICEDIERYRDLAQKLFEGVLLLPDPYQMSVAREDMDKSINYCRIFTEMSESFLDIIVSTPGVGFGDLRTLELLLTCCGHHQYEVADITFNYWYRLSEILYQRNCTELTQIFKPYIERLILLLCKHCQIDPDHEGVADKKDEFGDFRHRVSELIRDIIFIVGSAACFTQMFDNLKSSGAAAWDVSEASLYIMCAMANNLLTEENVVVPGVLQAVLSLPGSTHIALVCTSVELIGELAEWISHHPDYLDAVLQFLLSGIQKKELSSSAALSLQKLCGRCQNQIVSNFPGLVQIISAMDTFQVNKDAAIGLLKGAALVLSKMEPDKINDGLQQLCILQTTPLQKILKTGASKTDANLDPVTWLDRLSSIFRNVKLKLDNGQVHPCLPTIQEVWPVLSETCRVYQADVRIVERCCRCIRFVIRCLGNRSTILLTPLVTQIVELYNNHQHSCFLYLGSVLVDEHGTDPNCAQGLIDMLQAFWPSTVAKIGTPESMQSHPDVVDDLFRLCTRLLQKCPVLFLQCNVITQLLQGAISATSLSHREANPTVTTFLIEFCGSCAAQFKNKENSPQSQILSQKLLEDNGQLLVNSLMNAALYHLPTCMIVDTAEVMYELKNVNTQALGVWLQQTLESLPKQSSTGTTHATAEQLNTFHNAVLTAENEKQLYRGLCTFCRLYR